MSRYRSIRASNTLASLARKQFETQDLDVIAEQLPNLRLKIEDLEKDIYFLETEDTKYNILDRELKLIIKNKDNYKSIMGIKTNILNSTNQKHVERIKEEKISINHNVYMKYKSRRTSSMPSIYDFIFSFRRDLKDLNYKLNVGERHIKNEERQPILRAKKLARDQRAAQTQFLKEERLERQALFAQAHLKNMRGEASIVKKRITKSDACPYCGKNIGNVPHADHIHPVSKGGLSVPTNMVFVCQPCNTLKKDMTLGKFIKKYNLNSNKIHAALELLGKDY